MDFFNYTYLNAHGYLNKFRQALRMPNLTLSRLAALLKTMYKQLGWERLFYDDTKKNVVWSKSDLNMILTSPYYLDKMLKIEEMWGEKEYQEELNKSMTDTPTIYNNPETDMDYVSQELLDNDDIGPHKMVGENKKKKRIFITEEQLTIIKQTIDDGNKKITTYAVEPSKVLAVKKFLDDTFVRASMPMIGDDGYPKNLLIVGMKGHDGNVLKNMTDKQLFYLLQDKFSKIYMDKNQRDKFLIQILKDWYKKKISKDGLLTVNRY